MDDLKKKMASVLCILTKVADQADVDHARAAAGGHYVQMDGSSAISLQCYIPLMRLSLEQASVKD